MTRTWQKWLPAAVVPAVIIVGALTVPLQAGAAVDLPARTPEQVLALVGQSSVRALSGTIEQTSALGLPQLPSTGPTANAAASSALELLTGSHTARVYLNGPDNIRVQVMDKLAERDFVRQGGDVWFYNSKDNTAVHATLPEPKTAPPTTAPPTTAPPTTAPPTTAPGGDAQTPATLAKRMLAAVDASTTVSVGTDTTVAGRTAYSLLLTPRSPDTLVGAVSIAVDSATGLPLRVEVRAKGQATPAFSLAFTELTLQAPAAELFTFTPPAGAKVTEQKGIGQKGIGHSNAGHSTAKQGATHGAGDKPGMFSGAAVTGSGWDAVLTLPAGTVPARLSGNPLFTQLTTAVSGGRLLSSALLTVLITDDGRVFAGSVPAERLQAAAATAG